MLKELRTHLTAGRNAQAVEIADILLNSAPDNIDVLHLGAIAHARTGNAQVSQDLFERAPSRLWPDAAGQNSYAK